MEASARQEGCAYGMHTKTDKFTLGLKEVRLLGEHAQRHEQFENLSNVLLVFGKFALEDKDNVDFNSEGDLRLPQNMSLAIC